MGESLGIGWWPSLNIGEFIQVLTVSGKIILAGTQLRETTTAPLPVLPLNGMDLNNVIQCSNNV